MAESYYQYHVFFCTNQREDGKKCCGLCAADELREYMKQRVKALGLRGKGAVRVNNAGCLDRCAYGPLLVIYPDAVWYRYENKADIDEIIHSHLQQGQIVSHLRIEK
jgi:(2Fe-2S) ferredoxin